MKNFLSLVVVWSFIQVGLFAQGSPTIQVKTAADLVAVNIPNVSTRLSALLTGVATENDGKGGLFFYQASSAVATNAHSIFKPAGSGGRWLRATINISEEDGSPSVLRFTGLKFTNATVTDNGDGTVSIAVGGAGGSTAWDAIGDPSGAGTVAFGATVQTITGSGSLNLDLPVNFGTAGVQISNDGDGAITLLGLGNGSDENWTFNLDDTPNVIVHTTTTGVTLHRWTGMGAEFGGNITPVTSDASALGTGTLMWSDLFLALGGVVNWNNGDVLMTHSANLLTISGGDFVANGPGITFDASGFNGNLNTGQNTIQELADAVDDLALGGGGSAPVGTMVNSGASTANALPGYTDLTGTNLAPTSVTVTLKTNLATGTLNVTNYSIFQGTLNFPADTSDEIASGVTDDPLSFIFSIEAEGGPGADDLVTIGDPAISEHQMIIIWPEAGSTITIKHAVDNIICANGADVTIGDSSPNRFAIAIYEFLAGNWFVLVDTQGSGAGDVTAASAFGTDNVMVRSDGTGKGVQATGIVIDDSDNITIPGTTTVGTGNGTIAFGTASVRATGDGDGALTFLGLGDGSDEDWTFNLDDTANVIVHSSSTGVTTHRWTGIGMEFGGTISPITSDVGALGTGALMWADLFLASGGVINWNNGNYTLTHSAGNLAFSGTMSIAGVLTQTGNIELNHATQNTLSAASGDLSIEGVVLAKRTGGNTFGGAQLLAEGASIQLDTTGSADGAYSGTTRDGTAGTTLAFGDLVVLDATDSRWELADANSASGADGDSRGIIGICVLAAAADGSATTILLSGIVRADAVFPALTVNGPVYISETAGDITHTSPTTEDNIVRILGAALTADEIYFNPAYSWVVYDAP